jgi:glutathione synthase/RimK-type ligase-like ATP-grasp enzyme
VRALPYQVGSEPHHGGEAAEWAGGLKRGRRGEPASLSPEVKNTSQAAEAARACNRVGLDLGPGRENRNRPGSSPSP